MTKTERTDGVPLTELPIGEVARIAHVDTPNRSLAYQLSSLGLTKGVEIRLNQRWPSYVLMCEETEIAIEESIARTIFVTRDGR